MRILAIETSCDDTGIAILKVKNNKKDKSPDFLVLANFVASQTKVHQKYGGVFPAMAKREHQRNLLPTFLKALEESKLLISNLQFSISNKFSDNKISKIKTILEREPELAKKLIPFLKKYKKPDVGFIAVTNGPGLEPCLWVGVNFARAISYFWDIPIIPVNHIEGHILVNFLNNTNYSLLTINLPAIALVVSGGHTQLILMNKIGDFKILGETRDDAAGECFDKAAKILGLGYPGGPIISALAEKSQITNPKSQLLTTDYSLPTLPRPMINTKDYDFSFSGLKTAILYKVKNDIGHAPLRPSFVKTKKGKEYVGQMSVEIQQAIIDVLLKKTLKAVKDFNAKSIILGGGVSANQELKKQFTEKAKEQNVNVIFPEPVLSTDNGLMIAVTGHYNKNKIVNWEDLKADSNLRIGE
jgi:N6-L-threonylcarbamoyladenine synthase